MLVATQRAVPLHAGIPRRRAGRCRRIAPCLRRWRSAPCGRGKTWLWIVQGMIGNSSPAASSAAPARPGFQPAARPTRISASTAKTTPTSRYSGRNIAVAPSSSPGSSHLHLSRGWRRGRGHCGRATVRPRPPSPYATRAPIRPYRIRCPEEGEDRGGQGEDRGRLAVEGAGRVDERGVDGYRESSEESGRPAVDPPAEQVDDDDRGQAEQQLDDPRGPFARPTGRVEVGGVEQRRPRRPVAGVFEGRARRSFLPYRGPWRARSRRGRRRPEWAAARPLGKRAGRSRSRGSPRAGSGSCGRGAPEESAATLRLGRPSLRRLSRRCGRERIRLSPHWGGVNVGCARGPLVGADGSGAG